ncbi:transposase domain-containing protein [Escherichia coli]|nr:transposase domain-containing protein [Escherichia coli]MCD4184379.1 transposase domain-containing protein [Escherichia coli]MCD4200087.1 transposase domain-containing protein [Escherichia coli]
MSVRNLHQIVNRLDIMLPGSSAVLHARQRLGSGAIRCVFTQTAQL